MDVITIFFGGRLNSTILFCVILLSYVLVDESCANMMIDWNDVDDMGRKFAGIAFQCRSEVKFIQVGP
ncbi:hypothetical protein NQ314_008478 [Rhamnusium bicolor]|uniref:Uncharacterized protein n=1 Tax=Rhamnusium bicolor TaxID=1586634 RepID=A0AAV8Y9F0_9CUCU|nr:hypothetical protein NQ314_008478 [Rhamnusium bicolor]